MKEIERLGRMDIHLIDQLMKGRIDPGSRILDAGCGRGRNVEYLLSLGLEVSGTDRDPRRIDEVRELAARIAPAAPTDRFLVAELDDLPFPDDAFDFVICNAVLHFARDPEHFDAMIDECARVLAPGGHLFARLASKEGIGDLVDLGRGRYRQPDGDERYLVTFPEIRRQTARIEGTFADEPRTTVVDGLRSMMTWVVAAKDAPASGTGRAQTEG